MTKSANVGGGVGDCPPNLTNLGRRPRMDVRRVQRATTSLRRLEEHALRLRLDVGVCRSIIIAVDRSFVGSLVVCRLRCNIPSTRTAVRTASHRPPARLVRILQCNQC